jgi:1-acyl-sn-glycerol-3-phosphate acyltransferase
VVVSNHESFADILLISHLPWEMKWLSKAELFRIPVMGWMMWLAGDIPVKRGFGPSAVEAMERCREALRRRVSVMIFPEGTRSRTAELLPFRDGAFREVTHLWCLYHVDDPRRAVAEARRVLGPGGRYYASTSARSNDPELVPDGYPSTSFDAEDAPRIVTSGFHAVTAEHWDEPLVTLSTREEVRSYCRHHFVPLERADAVAVPLQLTKRGVLVRAVKD